MVAFLYVKTSSRGIYEELSFSSFFQKNADVSILVRLVISKTCVYSSSPWKDMLFSLDSYPAQNPLHLAGNVLTQLKIQ